MTNILLSIIAVLLFARIALQVRQGKRAVEKGYAAPGEVENKVRLSGSLAETRKILNEEAMLGFEISFGYEKNGGLLLFFTRKKIKTYYEG